MSGTNGFMVRRDSSANNVPVVGYQDTADAQDVILWAAVQVTETGNTDAQGIFHASHLPIIDTTHDWSTDGNGTPRQRVINGKDVTAQGQSGTLYVGTVDGIAGTIPLYTDSGLTTSAVNQTGVTVTYTTLAPVSADSQGRLQVSLSGATLQISGPLPAGTNQIGNVGIVGALPAGTNNIGQVELLDSAGNGLKVMSYTSGDGYSVPTNPLATSALPWLYNGDGTASRVRNSKKFVNQTFTASGPANFWTPQSGKSVALRGWLISANCTCTVNWRVNGSDIAPAMNLAPGVPLFVELPNIWIVGSASQILGVDITNVSLPSGVSTPSVGVLAWGTEE